MTRSQQSQPAPSTVLRQLAPFATLGVELAVTVLAGGAIGWFLDNASDTKPLWTVVGFIVGVVAAIVQFTRTVQRLTRERRTTQLHRPGGAEH
ncbi:MAG: hypothetical protein KatS3mg039_0476 [Candidatus Kapaibacterium sp.]|nr:MAG: hypothetical protein KatS3mg039_0476 [Candidatus Kapabacteria bacterium]